MSIPANIAEGRRQESEREFMRFLRYSLNSASELEYHVMVARDITALPEAESQSLLNELIEVRKMLYGLLHAIRSSQSLSHPARSDSRG
jgi:four helix bundle protein